MSDHAWEDSGKFEGDLILNERQRRLIVEDVAEGLARNGISDGTKRWPNNEVIVYIQREHFCKYLGTMRISMYKDSVHTYIYRELLKCYYFILEVPHSCPISRAADKRQFAEMARLNYFYNHRTSNVWR